MIPVKKIMTKEVVTVKTDTRIIDALNLLTKNEISGLPVVDENMHLVGILTEKDVLRILLNSNVSTKATVSEFMSRKVTSFKEDDNVTDVCTFFIKNPIRRVPIVRDKKVIGIVSRRDIIKLILEARNEIFDFRFN